MELRKRIGMCNSKDAGGPERTSVDEPQADEGTGRMDPSVARTILERLIPFAEFEAVYPRVVARQIAG